MIRHRHRISTALPLDLIRKLKRASKLAGKSRAELLVLFIKWGLERLEAEK